MIDIKNVKQEAAAQVVKEQTEKAKNALVRKMRQLEDAKQIVRNITNEIADLEASIVDGSFAG